MRNDGECRRWAVLVATVWIQALTGTNFDFSAYSSALKSSLGISQEALNYLATASDLGKALGWSSGLALLYLPLPAVLLLSAALGLASYALQYCLLLPPSAASSSPSLTLPYPVVFLACLIAGCSICWFNTVCFVLCIRNFSASNRPLALSLSISFNGLSAALYTLFANALSSPSAPSVYLLLNAVLPLAVSIVALPAILLRRHPHDGGHLRSAPTRHDRRVFLGLYILAFIIGLYLVVFGSFTTTTSAARVILAGAMALLALPLITTASSGCSHADPHGPDPASPLGHDDDPQKPLLIDSDHQRGEPHGDGYQLQGCCCGTTVPEKGRVLVLGEEHGAKRLIRCVDFWLYYTAYFCGATVGLVYSNNLGQIAHSLHRQSQLTMLLAVYSSCSFFGRLLSALPDFLHSRKVSFARTGWLAAALVPMPVAFFLMWRLHDETTLVAGTAVIGLSSGFIFAAAVSVTSELFGPNSIGVNHNILITNIPLGSLLYGQVAAVVYDANGVRMAELDNRTGMVDTMVMCMGAKCYSTTFFVWACITLLGFASSVALFLRTRPAYAAVAGQCSCKHLSQVSS